MKKREVAPGTEPVLLDALAELLQRSPAAVSWERLSGRLGYSREGLASAVDELRALGAPLVETAEGLTLELADRLDAEAIRDALPKNYGVLVRRVCASTNEELRASTPPAVCVAEAQTAGRGRRGRDWVQPFGAGLALSFLAPAPRGRLDPLALALAAGVAGALHGLGYAEVKLKWPNDLWARGRKLGGVLVIGEGGAAPRLVVGLGLNVHAAPRLTGREAVALADLAPPPSRNLLAARLTRALAATLARYEAEGFAPFAHEFAALDALAGCEVTWSECGGSLRGIARGIDATGALILDTPQGRLSRRAGEVSLTRMIHEGGRRSCARN